MMALHVVELLEFMSNIQFHRVVHDFIAMVHMRQGSFILSHIPRDGPLQVAFL